MIKVNGNFVLDLVDKQFQICGIPLKAKEVMERFGYIKTKIKNKEVDRRYYEVFKYKTKNQYDKWRKHCIYKIKEFYLCSEEQAELDFDWIDCCWGLPTFHLRNSEDEVSE